MLEFCDISFGKQARRRGKKARERGESGDESGSTTAEFSAAACAQKIGQDRQVAISFPASRPPQLELRLNESFLKQLRKHYTVVTSPAELPGLPAVIGAEEEIACCPIFSPVMIDACCRNGLFPLAIELGRGIFCFAPQCQKTWALALLVPPEQLLPQTLLGGAWGATGRGLLLRPAQQVPGINASRARACRVFFNRPEDIEPVFAMIRRQHGDNWLCQPHRVCLLWMLQNPEKFPRTRVLVTALRESEEQVAARLAAADAAGGGDREPRLVACELGFVTGGDMYLSATGAYAASGCGVVQLASLAAALQRAGFRVWNLGYPMEYKARMLNTAELPREEWHRFMPTRLRVDEEGAILKRLLGPEVSGKLAFELLGLDVVAAAVAEPGPSKAARKREAKAARIATKKEQRAIGAAPSSAAAAAAAAAAE